MAFEDGQDEINNSEDIIDSRNVIARAGYLESERESITTAISDLETKDAEEFTAEDKEELARLKSSLEDWDNSNGDELKALQELQKDAEGYASDWRHGCTLIRDSYFQTYAEELAGEVGAINSEAGWPANCIDWERAANELKVDYTSVSFDGVDYWVR